MTPQEKKKLEMLPELMRHKIMNQRKGGNIGKKERTVLGYSSTVKLRAVIRWKERMVRKGITVKKLGDIMQIEPIRISEWLNFSHEPNEENFNKVEKALYKLGV